MGIIARIPKDIYKEIKEIQRKYKLENGIDISFPKAMRLWKKRLLKESKKKIVLSRFIIEQMEIMGATKVEEEAWVEKIFKKIYPRLGFDRIVKIQKRFPDCIAIKNGERVRIEFEYKSKNFFKHGHNPNNCDYVVCWEKNADVGNCKVIPLKNLMVDIHE